jgi:hypothetical protein
LWGLWAFYLVRGDPTTARELGGQLLTVAQDARDPALLLRVPPVSMFDFPPVLQSRRIC